MGSEGQIQVPSIWQKLTRTLQVKGRTVAPELGAVVHPVAIVEDITSRTRYDSTEKVAAGQGTSPAGVGLFSGLGIFNAVGSGVIALIDKIGFSSGIISTWQLSLENSDIAAGTGATAYFRDRRLGLNTQPSIRTFESFQAAAGSSRPIVRIDTAANVPVIIDDTGILLPPGTGLYIFLTIVNQGIDGWMWWREFPETP